MVVGTDGHRCPWVIAQRRFPVGAGWAAASGVEGSPCDNVSRLVGRGCVHIERANRLHRGKNFAMSLRRSSGMSDRPRRMADTGGAPCSPMAAQKADGLRKFGIESEPTTSPPMRCSASGSAQGASRVVGKRGLLEYFASFPQDWSRHRKELKKLNTSPRDARVTFEAYLGLRWIPQCAAPPNSKRTSERPTRERKPP